MKVIKGLTAVAMILIVAVITGQSAQLSRSAQDQEILRRQFSIHFSDQATIRSLFSRVLLIEHIPGGTVTLSNCNQEAEYQVTEGRISLRDVLDDIVSKDRTNRWEIEDGVVNLIPIASTPALLDLRIDEFNVEGAITASHALARLLRLPEVQEQISQLHLQELGTEPGLADLKRPGSNTDTPEHRFNVHCQNVTLRDALNAIVRAHGYAVWAYTEWDCVGKTQFRIDFMVQ